ncbi:MAG: hypothetical protein ITG00_09065 [Flavobacterium sp.]|nr:hypothetical protein [Flavobacterium sp.]
MKIFIILLMIFAIGFAFYEQSREGGNTYLVIIAIVIFMIGMMRLSAKTPSKNQDENES